MKGRSGLPCGCSRRQFVRLTVGAGIATQFGLPFGTAQETRDRGSAKRAILIFLWGGPSQLDTFDPKPSGPNAGEFRGIESAVRGVHLSEHLPRIAAQMKDLSLIRTLNSRDPNHDTAQYMLHTGYRRAGDLEHPHVGSVILNELGGAGDLPGCIVIGSNPPAGAGYLAADRGPIVFDKLDAPADDVLASPNQDRDRLEKRWKLLSQFDRSFSQAHDDSLVKAREQAYEKAYRALTSDRVKAFDVRRESDDTRGQYGDSPFGRACLMSRRLIDSGVRFVEVMFGSWDTHNDNFTQVRDLSKQLDAGLSALVTDLKRRNMLADTLVVCTGEFGRTPRINATNGRDHWIRGWSALMAGGGIAGGRVVGATTDDGMEIASRPVGIQDFYATIYRCMGIDPGRKYMAGTRPMKVLDGGEPVAELL